MAPSQCMCTGALYRHTTLVFAVYWTGICFQTIFACSRPLTNFAEQRENLHFKEQPHSVRLLHRHSTQSNSNIPLEAWKEKKKTRQQNDCLLSLFHVPVSVSVFVLCKVCGKWVGGPYSQKQVVVDVIGWDSHVPQTEHVLKCESQSWNVLRVFNYAQTNKLVEVWQ